MEASPAWGLRVALCPLEGRTPSPRVPSLPASWGSSSLITDASLSPGKLGSAPSSVPLHLQTPSQAEPTGGRGSGLRPSCCLTSVSAGHPWSHQHPFPGVCACVHVSGCVCVSVGVCVSLGVLTATWWRVARAREDPGPASPWPRSPPTRVAR